MKVLFPCHGVSFTSKDILPASCTSKPQISCTSIPKPKVNEGYSNQEIYETLVTIKENFATLFNGNKKQTDPVDYIA